MKPVTFPGVNLVLGKDQPEYQDLPVHLAAPPEGEVISCWELSDEDIEALCKTKKLWISQLTFGGAFQPQLPSTLPPAALAPYRQ